MTREEAIMTLRVEYSADVKNNWNEALKMAIKALEQEPCEDGISRAEAIDALGYDISIVSDEGLDKYRSVIKEMLCKIYDVQKANIEKLPPITPKPKTGHWIRVTDKEGHLGWKCDKCGWQQRFNNNFCPDCGEKMESEDKE